MTATLQDLGYSLRALAKRPVYMLVAVLVFALAIGANTTVFSISNAFFMRPLPYPDDDRLVVVFNAYPGMGLDFAGTSIPDYLDRREQATSLEELAIFSNTARTLSGDESPQRGLVDHRIGVQEQYEWRGSRPPPRVDPVREPAVARVLDRAHGQIGHRVEAAVR